MALELEGLGTLITIKGQEPTHCLGYLINFADKGTFDAQYGRVDVSREHAEVHNKALTTALIEGLDKHCKVGQSGAFYLNKRDGKQRVITFDGVVVSEDVSYEHKKAKTYVVFKRNGKTFRGLIRKDDDLFHFTRVT